MDGSDIGTNPDEMLLGDSSKLLYYYTSCNGGKDRLTMESVAFHVTDAIFT